MISTDIPVHWREPVLFSLNSTQQKCGFSNGPNHRQSKRSIFSFPQFSHTTCATFISFFLPSRTHTKRSPCWFSVFGPSCTVLDVEKPYRQQILRTAVFQLAVTDRGQSSRTRLSITKKSMLPWSIAPVSRRSWVRIPLEPQIFVWAFFVTA